MRGGVGVSCLEVLVRRLFASKTSIQGGWGRLLGYTASQTTKDILCCILSQRVLGLATQRNPASGVLDRIEGQLQFIAGPFKT